MTVVERDGVRSRPDAVVADVSRRDPLAHRLAWKWCQGLGVLRRRHLRRGRTTVVVGPLDPPARKGPPARQGPAGPAGATDHRSDRSQWSGRTGGTRRPRRSRGPARTGRAIWSGGTRGTAGPRGTSRAAGTGRTAGTAGATGPGTAGSAASGRRDRRDRRARPHPAGIGGLEVVHNKPSCAPNQTAVPAELKGKRVPGWQARHRRRHNLTRPARAVADRRDVVSREPGRDRELGRRVPQQHVDEPRRRQRDGVRDLRRQVGPQASASGRPPITREVLCSA